jgi:hypothetical protein
MLSAMFFLLNYGPMQSHRQNSLLAIVDPFNIIDSILGEQFWAHMKPSAKYLSRTVGPCEANGKMP